MAFWGIEVKPGKPYIHRYENERGRLHISQATLGSGSSTKKSKVQCNVGYKSPIYLCSLLPERLETCALNLEFEEEDEVTFSVIGPHSVHLSGFFYGENDQDKVRDDSGSDSYEENIVGSDSEEEDDLMNYDSEDEDEEADFIDDDDLGIYPPSPVPNSGVRIEEIVDDEKPVNENGVSKRAKKKKSQSNVSDDNVNSDRQLVVKGGHDVPVLESEDDDGFPVSASREIKDDNADEEALKKKPKTEASKKSKRKIDAVGRDAEHPRENDTPHGSSDPTDNVSQNDAKTKKKNKKKKATKEAQQTVLADSNDAEQLPVAEMENDLKATSDKKKEKKKKNIQNKTEEIASNRNADQSIKDKNGSTLEMEEKQEAKPLQVRTYPNGLVIEELAMGKPDGKRASPGKKVTVHYIGKLKNNGKIFDSNIGRTPFKFRLGIGQVIKGWDVGVNGMRIGDKRRLKIPPAMGYGAKGAGGTIPPNSWLVFDVELVDVN
ncbi:peptidyl-prolyl cis-trans isomerase FKBP53-like isoform X2 [Olea europaea var. sylvestris]|uniref:peptidyl-prolyl cis-trans isomerase FKBP53-like isoform X2 n=1 Tax=Olea europaea var. sylvestris TaxID=158386 RepID=UPI000C1CF993|nr:peptidyl-prolyl cis-trans isomerase FKBP53-like isoform X2 [Olea europaea var. sylvestris]